jgi:hypothetical protein
MMPLLQQLQQQRQSHCASPTPTTPSSSHDGLDGASSSTESTPARPHRHQQRSQQQQQPPASEPKLTSSSASIVAPLLIEVDATLEADVALIASPVPVVVSSLPTEAAAAAPLTSSPDLVPATTTTVAAAPAAAPLARPPGQANRLRFASMAIVSANPICVPDPALFDNTDVTPLSASPRPGDEDDDGDQNLNQTVLGRAGSPSPVTPITAAAEAAFEARTAAALAAAAAAAASSTGVHAATEQHDSETLDEELLVPTRRSSEVFHQLTRNCNDDADDDEAALRAVVDAAASSASSSPAGPALPLILPSAPVGLGGCGDERDGGFGFEPQQHDQQQGSVVIPPLPLTLVLPDAPPASFDNYYRANINENGSTTNSPQNVLRTVGGIGAAAGRAAVRSAVTMAASTDSGRHSRVGGGAGGGVGLSSHATASAVRPVSAKGLSIQLLQSPNSGASLPASAQQQQQQYAEEIVPYDDEYGYDEDAEDDAVDFWEAMDSGVHKLF